MRAGRWLSYLTDVARAAGHPVPIQAATLMDKEYLAWSGVLDGFADKLRAEASKIADETELRRAVLGAIRRVDIEYRAAGIRTADG